MKITVAIPVYNEEKYIASCLESIMRGTRLPDEILVADGGSVDRTREIARELGATVIPNPRKNAASGRNECIKRATGDVILFTDGDCVPKNDWVECYEKAFEVTRADGIGGKIIPAKPVNDIEAYWCNLQLNIVMNFGDEPYWVTKRSLNDAFITANCAFRRKFLCRMHGFNNWFANNGEDVELCWRGLAKGARFYYCPNPVVEFHGVTSMKELRRKSMRNGVSSSKLQKVYGKFINYDVRIYKELFRTIKRVMRHEKWSWYNLNELIWHLLGKYVGSIKAGVINV